MVNFESAKAMVNAQIMAIIDGIANGCAPCPRICVYCRFSSLVEEYDHANNCQPECM
jgi:hypothetical protein